MANGRLFLIPSPLGEYAPEQVIPAPVLEKLRGIRRYVVEETRTVRRYLSAAGLKGHIGLCHRIDRFGMRDRIPSERDI